MASRMPSSTLTRTTLRTNGCRWSIRRQVSHMAWDLLIVMYRRCHRFLWPDGNVPTPIRWEDHRLGTVK